MAKPFKFRYVNQIAGTFVAGIILLVIASVVLVGRAKKWFGTVSTFNVMLPAEGSFGLKPGGEVRMMGVTVGAIDTIDPPKEDTGRMLMQVHLEPQFARFVRSGGPAGGASQAIIRLPLVLGDPYLEFTRGQGAPIDGKLVTLNATPEASAGDAVTQTVADVRTHTLPAVQALVEQYTQLAIDMRSREGPLQETLGHINALTANLARTDSVLGHLTADKTMADQLNNAVAALTASSQELQQVLGDLQHTSGALPAFAAQGKGVIDNASHAVSNIQDATAQLPAVMASLKQTTQTLPAMMDSLKQTVDTLPGVMAHTQESLVEIEKLIKAMEALPLIRNHVDTASTGGSLQPTDVEASP
jgi:phospholipid/cholesterol/gamma-HCH transport system substrate-binding protein